MPTGIRIACPQCQAVFSVETAVAPDEPLLCPKCGTRTLAPGSDATTAPVAQPTLTLPGGEAPTLTSPPDVADHQAEPRERTGESLRLRYTEQEVIGRGGMGEVVLCIDRDIRRPIALKRMLPSAAEDPARRARFVEEAQVTGQLEHPNIVPIHELATAPDGTAYFTMKLVRGKSLADILRNIRDHRDQRDGRENVAQPPSAVSSAEAAVQPSQPRAAVPHSLPSLGDLLQIFLKVCDGVAFAHSRGVVHRDLKPANIMVGDYGEVLVMDWGLAKIVKPDDGGQTTEGSGGGATLGESGHASRVRGHDAIVSDRQEITALQTLAGSMLGTPAYMSPEQAKGELDLIDARSDIWSLGAILYEILALERAFAGETTYAILAAVLKGNIVPPEQRAPSRNVPRELSAIVMKCLTRTRARRYGSVLDLKRDLALYLEGRSVSASPDTFSQAIVKLVKRNKAVSAAIAIALSVLSVLSVLFVLRLTAERDRAIASEGRAVANEKAAVAARDAQRATALAASKRQAESAVRAASEGRLDEAKVRADAAVEVMPDGPWGHYALGVLAHEKKDFATARKHLDEALRLNPAHGPSKLLHTTVLAASGDLAKWEQLAAEAEKCMDWKALLAAGDALFAAQRNRQSIKAYESALALMQKEPAIPGVARGELKDKLARSEACLKMEGFYSSIRNLPDGVQRERILAKLKEIGMPAYRDWVEVENGRLKRVEFGFHGGTRLLEIKWLDPIRGMPIESLVLHATGVGDLGPLRGMPLKRLDLQLNRQVCDLSPLEGMALEALNCSSTGVSDLRPLKGMKLRELVCNNTRVTDLGPLEGMPLEVLSCTYTGVTKLAPLRGMPLRTLVLAHCQVADLTPLEGMPLNELMCPGTVVSDLGPLRGMPLTTLYVAATQVRDLSPLAGMKLQWLAFHPQNIKKGMDVVRAMKSINRITVGLGTLHLGVHDFWKRYDAGEFSK